MKINRAWIATAVLFMIGLVIIYRARLLSHTAPRRPSYLMGYNKWHAVTKIPQFLDHSTASLCVNPSPDQSTVGAANNPHNQKFFRVYANSLAKPGMMPGAPAHFPPGSIIIKEKLASKSSATPELLTVMEKQKPGYDSANGDWEYSVVNGAVTKFESRGKLQTCQTCHATQKANDYVFRDYKQLYGRTACRLNTGFIKPL